jgi:hypothetical protein
MSSAYKRRCLGLQIAISGVALAGVASADGVEQLVNGSFEAGQDPWWNTANLAPDATDGRLCMNIPAGTTNPWDVIIGQAGVPILEGETYELSFDASSTPAPVVVRALVQDPATYATFTDKNPALSPETQHFAYTFTAGSGLASGEFQFQLASTFQTRARGYASTSSATCRAAPRERRWSARPRRHSLGSFRMRAAKWSAPGDRCPRGSIRRRA